MENFILIQDTRLLRSVIKRYQPIGECDLAIYFSPLRGKMDKEIFKYDTKEKRDEMLQLLDTLL